MLRVTAGRFATVESQVRSALAAQFDEDLAVEVWEGGPHHTSGVLEEVRSTVRTFSLVVNLLGVLLLATGGVGLAQRHGGGGAESFAPDRAVPCLRGPRRR